MKKNDYQQEKDRIVQDFLPDIVFDGWCWRALEKNAAAGGTGTDLLYGLFPRKMDDVLDHYADMIDRAMMDQLAATNIAPLRIRDRIKTALMVRFAIIEQDRDAELLAGRYWSVPSRAGHAAQIIWRTADRIWLWAGDESHDYNFYTKRGLLSGVVTASWLAWADGLAADPEQNTRDDLESFIDRRIENVMKLGRFVGRIKTFAVRRK